MSRHNVIRKAEHLVGQKAGKENKIFLKHIIWWRWMGWENEKHEAASVRYGLRVNRRIYIRQALGV